MINPSFNTSITIYHQTKEIDEEKKRTLTKWIRTVIEDCYFGSQTAESLSGTTLSQASSYLVRIPKNKAHALIGVGDVLPGDVIIKGVADEDIEDVSGKRISDVLAKYKPNCFTVRTFSDNTKISYGAHYKVTGV